MKKLLCGFVLAITYFISTAFALSGDMNDDGRYYSPNHLFSVIKPDMADLSIQDLSKGHFQTVIFQSGQGFWMMDGKYSVDFLSWPRPYRKASDMVLMKLIGKAMMSIMRSGEIGTISSISEPQCHFLKVRGKQAYQCIYRFSSPAQLQGYFVGTMIPFNQGIINCYGLESVNKDRKFQWDRYNAMLNSIDVYSATYTQ